MWHLHIGTHINEVKHIRHTMWQLDIGTHVNQVRHIKHATWHPHIGTCDTQVSHIINVVGLHMLIKPFILDMPYSTHTLAHMLLNVSHIKHAM